MNYINGAPFPIFTTSGGVKQLKGKPVTLLQSKYLSVPHTLHVIYPIYKIPVHIIFCQIFV